MVGVLHVRRSEKIIGTNFYRLILLIRLNCVEILKHFATEKLYIRLYIVQELLWTYDILPQKIIPEDLI